MTEREEALAEAEARGYRRAIEWLRRVAEEHTGDDCADADRIWLHTIATRLEFHEYGDVPE